MKAKTVNQLIKQLQPIFNKYIRLRDKDEPCISCGEHRENYDAGHFYPVGGYSGLRFDEDNCHKECKKCNGFDPMHLLGYQRNLRQRIGQAGLDNLKDAAEHYRMYGVKWSRPELREKIEYYKEKIKELS